jgi:hypothetical protein
VKIFEVGEKSFCFTDLPEATVAYRACFDAYGQEDSMTKSIFDVVYLAIETDTLPHHYLDEAATGDLVHALGMYAARSDIDPWQCAQAEFMLKLVFAPSDSLQ